MLDVYRAFCEEMLAMPVLCGPKTESEKFAGALRTYAIEALMGDGQALQAGTSHNLGQHFSEAYGIEYLDKNQQRAQALVDVLGHLDPHDRRADHDPRRRLGPDPAAEGRAVPGGDRADPAPEGRLERGDPAEGARGAGDAARRRLPRRTSTTATSSSPATSTPTGRCAACRCASRSGRRTSRRTSACSCGATTARRSSCRSRARPRRLGELLDAMQKDLLERARAFVAANTTRVSSYDEFKQVMADEARLHRRRLERRRRRSRRGSRKRRRPRSA